MWRSWTFDGAPHRVECAHPVIDQISSAAREGFLSFRHGGMEIGGILVGATRGTVTRIVDARPLPITHGRGAQFLLTDEDHENLSALIQKTNAEVAARRLEVVGCYESRTRRDQSTAGLESEPFARYFSAPGHVCLTLKPDRENVATVAAYVRDEQSNVLHATSVEDLAELDAIDEAPIAPHPVAPAAVFTAPVREDPPSLPEPLVANSRPLAPEPYEAPRLYVSPAPSRKWKYGAGALALAVCIGSFAMLRSRTDQPPPATNPPATQTPAPPPNAPPASTSPVPAEGSSSTEKPALTGRARAKVKTNRTKRARQRATKSRRTAR